MRSSNLSWDGRSQLIRRIIVHTRLDRTWTCYQYVMLCFRDFRLSAHPPL